MRGLPHDEKQARPDPGCEIPEGEISLDFVGKKPGRGAYLCPDGACLARARKTKALERAFETAIPAEIYEALLAQMEAANGT